MADPQGRPATWADLIQAEAKAQGVPPNLALALAGQESSLDPTRVSPKGAIGLMQLMPETAKSLGVDPHDPRQNITGGIRYLKTHLDAYGGDVSKALAAYNAGPEAVNKAGGIPDYPETQAYVAGVLGRLRGAASVSPTSAQATRRAPNLPTVADLQGVPPAPPPGQRGGPLGQETKIRARTWGDTARDMGRAVVNDLPTIGAVATTAGAMALASETMGATIWAPALAAFVGGTSGKAGQQFINAETKNTPYAMGPPPPPSLIDAYKEQVGAGVNQAALELGGQTVPRVVQGLGRRLVTQRVVSQAQTALREARAELELRPGAITADATKAWGQAAPPPVPGANAAAGRAAGAVVRGPSQAYLDSLGRSITDAADRGPTIDIGPIKAKVQAMVEKALPASTAELPENAGFLQAAIANQPDKAAAITKQLADAGISLEPTHPLPGVLAKIGESPDVVSLAEAHKLKRALDETVNWDSPARTQVGQITKGIRGDLRDAMHAASPEYAAADQAYQETVPFFRQGYVPKLLKSLRTLKPEALVAGKTPIINAAEPTQAAALKTVLTTYAEKGGDAQAGQRAWDQIVDAYTNEHLVKGGVEKLPAKLAKMDPAFRDTLYSDPQHAAVLDRLTLISTAMRDALAATDREATQLGLTARSLSESSLTRTPNPAMTAADVLHTAVPGGGTSSSCRLDGWDCVARRSTIW